MILSPMVSVLFYRLSAITGIISVASFLPLKNDLLDDLKLTFAKLVSEQVHQRAQVRQLLGRGREREERAGERTFFGICYSLLDHHEKSHFENCKTFCISQSTFRRCSLH